MHTKQNVRRKVICLQSIKCHTWMSLLAEKSVALIRKIHNWWKV